MSNLESDAMTLRQLPAQGERVETGPLQIGDDWPGVFMRGDYAGPMAMYLHAVLDDIRAGRAPNIINMACLEGLELTLQSCRVHPTNNRGDNG